MITVMPASGLYSVIYADPGWKYRNQKTGGSHKSGAAQKYPVLSLPELIALPITKHFAPASVLFLWATVPMLPEGLALMEGWGFEFKTSLFWHKTGRLGTGFWFRGEIEMLLFGIRGPVKAYRSTIRNFFESRPTEHSRKPPHAREIIEFVTPGQRRLELFARGVHPGWDAVGLDVDGWDLREDRDDEEPDGNSAVETAQGT